MATVYEIPLSATPQRFSTNLGGQTWDFLLQFHDATGGGWTIDLSTGGASVLAGAPLVTGADLLAQYPWLGSAFGGVLFVFSDGAPDAVPTFTNLGSTAHLYFLTPSGTAVAAAQLGSPGIPAVTTAANVVVVSPPPPPPPRPIIVGPAASTIRTGNVLAVTGISVSDPASTGICSVTVSCSHGTIAMTSGGAVSGSGTALISNFQGELPVINAALATLAYTPPSIAGSDTIRIAFTDPDGLAQLDIPITITGIFSDPFGVQASAAQRFVSAFGVNMHVGTINDGSSPQPYNPISSGSFNAIAGNVNYLCCKLIRDWAYAPPYSTGGINYWPLLWHATGARYIGVTPGNIGAADAEAAARQYQAFIGANPGMFVAIDGMNEPDAEQSSVAVGVALGAQEQPVIASIAYASNVLCFAWSRSAVSFSTPGPDMSPYCDHTSLHIYFNPHMRGPNAPDGAGGVAYLDWAIPITAQDAPSRTKAPTEFGYQTPYSASNGVSAYAQAVYALQCMVAFFLRGCEFYCWYALYDDGSGNWGLFNTDFSPRQSATAIHNLFTVLQDTAPGAINLSTGRMAYSTSVAPVAANAQGFKCVLLQKSGGEMELVMVNEVDVTAHGGADIAVPASIAVTLLLGTQATTVHFYDPMIGTAPQNTWTNTSSVALSIPSHPCVVEVIH